MQDKSIVESARLVMEAFQVLAKNGRVSIYTDIDDVLEINVFDAELFDSIPLDTTEILLNTSGKSFKQIKQVGNIRFFRLISAQEHLERLALEREVC